MLLSPAPVIAAIAGLLVLGETLSIHRWLGIAGIRTATAVAVRHIAPRWEGGRRDSFGTGLPGVSGSSWGRGRRRAR
ncbi:hypothetical protein [Nocardia sp. X0981]